MIIIIIYPRGPPLGPPGPPRPNGAPGARPGVDYHCYSYNNSYYYYYIFLEYNFILEKSHHKCCSGFVAILISKARPIPTRILKP